MKVKIQINYYQSFACYTPVYITVHTCICFTLTLKLCKLMFMRKLSCIFLYHVRVLLKDNQVWLTSVHLLTWNTIKEHKWHCVKSVITRTPKLKGEMSNVSTIDILALLFPFICRICAVSVLPLLLALLLCLVSADLHE